MISTKYAATVVLLLTVALIPTTIHSYLGLMKDDGISVKNINPVLENFTSVLSKRNAGYGEETFGSQDWVERIYTDNAGDRSIRLFIAKGYDHKRLYHHPELALSYAKDLISNGQTRLATNTEVSVHLLKNDRLPNIAAYVLLYDGKSIDNPIIHQALDALNLLVSARKPMILFYISDDNPPKNTDFNQTPAGLILAEVIASYRSQSQTSLTK
jgi:hypothetical protein